MIYESLGGSAVMKAIHNRGSRLYRNRRRHKVILARHYMVLSRLNLLPGRLVSLGNTTQDVGHLLVVLLSEAANLYVELVHAYCKLHYSRRRRLAKT